MSSEARHGYWTGVSGQRPEQGAAATFSHSRNVGTRPLPCTVSLCPSPAADELIDLSTRLPLDFDLAVNSDVASSVDGIG